MKELNYYRPQCEWMYHKGTLEAYFRAHPVTSVQEAIAKIEDLTSIRRGPTQACKFLKFIGMRRLKTGTIPAKADPDEQETFKQDKLEPVIEEAKASKRILFFGLITD